MGRRRPLRRHGYLLLLAVALVAVLFSLGLAVVSFMRAHQNLVRKTEDTARSREAARAGLDLAVARLRREPAWRDGWPAQELVPGGNATVRIEGDPGDQAFTTAEGRAIPAGSVHVLCLGRGQTAQTVEEAIVGTASVLFEDDFNAGAGNWQQSSGLPVALLGNYVLNLGAEGNTLAGNETWTDYRADFRATLPQGTGIGFLVRVTGPPANPEGYLVEYQLLDNLLGGGTFRLSRLRNGVRTGLAQSTLASSGLSPLGWLLSLPHTFSVTVREDTIEVRVDGASILNATDPEPIPAGRVGIRPLLGTIVLVDKVTVTALFEVLSRWRR